MDSLTNKDFNRTTRRVGDNIIFPCGLAFVVKTLSEFDEKSNTVKAALTIILRIKIDGVIGDELEEEVITFLKESLRARVNDEEVSVKDDLKRKVVPAVSSTAQDDTQDILQYTIRIDTVLEVPSDDYHNYPFDTMEGRFTFELSQFKIGDYHFRFDIYHQKNPVGFKDDTDKLPILGVDWESTTMTPKREKIS